MATPTPAPFDRSLPSPIAPLLDLRASARSSVVLADELTDTQTRAILPTRLEDRLIDLATQAGAPALVVISGSAGGGKSAVIARLKERGDFFEDIIEDATHAETPTQEQREVLERFFAPLADDAPAYSGRPLLIAMNTGMVLRFFDQLLDIRGDDHSFHALEAQLKDQLGLPGAQAQDVPAGEVVVVNLDLRSTTGADISLFSGMLQALDPAAPDGIMAGAPRCATCRVRDACFVRTNAELASAPTTARILDRIADDAATNRGRPLQPRELWNFAVDIVTGGEPFEADDPCDVIAELAEQQQRSRTILNKLLPQSLFRHQSSAFPEGMHDFDPSYLPNSSVHDILTTTGMNPASDRDRFVRALNADGTRREAANGAAAVFLDVSDEDIEARTELGRALTRAEYVTGVLRVDQASTDVFQRALGEYAQLPVEGGDGTGDFHADALEELRRRVARALVIAFGAEAGPETYFLTRAWDPRRSHALYVAADLLDTDALLKLEPDPVRKRNARGADLVDYRPMSIVFRLADLPLDIDAPLFHLLRVTADGTKPSSADLERFFHLRRAAEALGRRAAGDVDRPLLISERQTGRQYRLAPRPDVLGNSILGVKEVSQ